MLKKLIIISSFLLSVNAFSSDDVIVLSHSQSHSSGFSGDLQVTRTERALTKKEIEIERNKDAKSRGMTISVSAFTDYKNMPEDGKGIPVYSYHQACFMNATMAIQQYGYRFELKISKDYAENSETFMLNPGILSCYNQNSFINYFPPGIGEYQITAMTTGAESGLPNMTAENIKKLIVY